MEPWQTIMLVGGIAVVCAAVLPRRATSSVQDSDNRTVRSMETALEQFMENMEADNREIADLVSKSNQEAQAQAAKREERLERLEKRCADLEHALAEQARRAALLQSPTVIAREEAPPAIVAQLHTPFIPVQAEAIMEDVEDAVAAEAATSIRFRYAELFDMYQAGKSIDAIAKKLGRNKGEIQLILQLSKQEEAARHE